MLGKGLPPFLPVTTVLPRCIKAPCRSNFGPQLVGHNTSVEGPTPKEPTSGLVAEKSMLYKYN